jgi:exopolysaccharide production protein ExoY
MLNYAAMQHRIIANVGNLLFLCDERRAAMQQFFGKSVEGWTLSCETCDPVKVKMTLSVDSLTIPRPQNLDQPPLSDCFDTISSRGKTLEGLTLPEQRPTVYERMGRVLDVVIAGFALTAMLPALLIIALLIWSADGGSPIFAHRRVGRGRRLFPCFKFRTMVMDADERLRHFLEHNPGAAEEWRRDHKLRDDPRITPIGRFLRKSSLDEIPQLVNVLLGHMSLVGPRPIVEEEQVRYGRYLEHYSSVRPGITGLWQVSGRNSVSYRRRVALDTHYTRSKKSLRFDLMILTMTIPAVVMARGSS